MPPTDLVKKLSRTDHLITKFEEFLHVQGIIDRNNEEMLYANPLPYSSTIFAPTENNLFKLYRCLAMSICFEKSGKESLTTNSINLTRFKLMSSDKFRYVADKNKIYLSNIVDNHIDIIARDNVNEITVIDLEMRKRKISHAYDDLSGYVLSIKSSETLSIGSAEPMVIKRTGTSIFRLFIPFSKLVLISEEETVIKTFREILIYENMNIVKGIRRKELSLIEILDPLTIALPIDFDRGCVELEMINPYDISYNAIIKVYGYIDEIILDNLTRFKPRYNIVRIAVPMYHNAKIKLCVSTSIPNRYAIVSSLNEFLQIF